MGVDKIWRSIKMHILKHKSKYRFAMIMVFIAISIIFLSLAIVTPPEEKHIGAIKTFDDNGIPAITYLLNYPEGNSLFTIIDSWGVELPGYPITTDNRFLLDTDIGDFSGTKIFCVIEKVGNNKFFVHLYDIYGGGFSDSWPLEIDTQSCSPPKIIKDENGDPLIIFHTENMVHVLNVYGEYLSNFPLSIDDQLNSRIAILSGNKIAIASSNGNFYIIDVSGNIQKIETGQVSEQAILPKDNKIVRPDNNGFQVVAPDKNYHIDMPEGVHDILQPLSISDDRVYIITNDKGLVSYNIDGDKDKSFQPITNFKDVYMPPFIENLDTDPDKEVVVGGVPSFGTPKIDGFNLPSGTTAPGFPFETQDIPYSPCLVDINGNLRKDLIIPCADGNIYCAETYAEEEGAGPWTMPENLEPELFYSPPQPPEPEVPEEDKPKPWTGMKKENYSIKCDKNIGVSGWDIYDPDPAGASITWCGPENAVRLKGQGTQNGYRLRNPNGSDWNEKKLKGIGFSLKYNEDFVVYISVDTIKGHRYIYYTPTEIDEGQNGTYIHHGLGEAAMGGNWYSFYRDLDSDLKEFEQDNEIIDINAFLIRGSGLVKNVYLFDAGKEKPYDSIQDLKKYKFETKQKFDEKGNLIEKIVYKEDGSVLKKEVYNYEWWANGKLKRKTITYYYGTTPINQGIWSYDESGKTIEYIYNYLNPNGDIVYTTSTSYEPDTKDNQSNTIKGSIVKSYYPNEGIGYQVVNSTYDKDNKISKSESDYYGCLKEGEDFIKGEFLYKLLSEYFYESSDNPNLCTKQIITKSIIKDGVLAEIEKQTYTDRKFDEIQRLVFQKLIVEKPGSPWHIVSKIEYSYTYGKNNNKYIYNYKDGQENWKQRNTNVYDKKWRNIEIKYEYPTYTSIYKDYQYSEYNKIKQFKIEINRPGIGKTETLAYYFYNESGDLKYVLCRYEDFTNIVKYIYDDYRRRDRYISINVSKGDGEKYLNSLNKGEEIDIENIAGLTKVTEQVIEWEKGRAKMLEDKYFYCKDGNWNLNNNVVVNYDYDYKLGQLGSVIYEHSTNNKKSAIYEYSYDNDGRLNSSRTRYYNPAEKNYTTYEYSYTYYVGTSRIDKVTTIIKSGEEKISEIIALYNSYDKNGQPIKITQYNIDVDTDSIVSLYETFYYYGSSIRRYVQLKYSVHGYSKEDIPDIEPNMLLDISEQRYLKWDKLGRLTSWQHLYWGTELKEDILNEEIDHKLAYVWRDITTHFDDIGRRKDLVYKDFKKNSDSYTISTYTYDENTGLLKQYKSERFLIPNSAPEKFYESMQSYKYDDKKRLLEQWIVGSYIDGDKLYTDITYTQDEITGFQNGATVINSRDIDGKKAEITKRIDIYDFDIEKSLLKGQQCTYFAAEENGWGYMYEDIYKDYIYKDGRTTDYTIERYCNKDMLAKISYNIDYDEIGRTKKYTYSYIYPNNPKKEYIYKYEVINDTKYSRTDEINYIYLKPNNKEFYRTCVKYTYAEKGLLTSYIWKSLYPDGQIPSEYKYTYSYDKFGRLNLSEREFYRFGKLFSKSKTIYNPTNGKEEESTYEYVNINKISYYYNYSYEKDNKYKSFRLDFYRDSINPENKTGSQQYNYNYNEKRQLVSSDADLFDNSGKPLATFKYKYNPSDSVYLGYEAINNITGNSLSLDIEEYKLTTQRKVIKTIKKSPPEIYTTIYNIDEYGRNLGGYTSVTKGGKLIRIEEETYNPDNSQLASWTKKFFKDDGITVKEVWECNNITYLNELYVGTEVVDVTISNPGNYTRTAVHHYDEMWRRVATDVTTTKGGNWTEYIDPVTGELLYIIDHNTGEKKEGGTPTGSSTTDTGLDTGTTPTLSPETAETSIETQITEELENRRAQEDISQQIDEEDINSIRYAGGTIIILEKEGKPKTDISEEIGSEAETLSKTEIISTKTPPIGGGAPAKGISAPAEEFIERAREPTTESFVEPLEYPLEIELQKRYEQERVQAIYRKYEAEVKDKKLDWWIEFIRHLLNRLIYWGKMTIPDIPKILNRFEKSVDKYF